MSELAAAALHLLLAAKSGWGKSWRLQLLLEQNIPRTDFSLTFDYKDEYRGLVKAGMAKHLILDRSTASRFGQSEWQALLRDNRHIVVARHAQTAEQWREAIVPAVRAARGIQGTTFLAFDEAHFVAPQVGAVPDAIEGVATTGRGEGVASAWATQRPAKLEETVLAQVDASLLGGFTSDADLNKIESYIDYPNTGHDPRESVAHLPEELHAADAGDVPVRKFTDGDGADAPTIGSEWIYSDDDGNAERQNSKGMTMETTHYSPQGHTIQV